VTKKYRVIIPQNIHPVPERFEVSAAILLLEYFQSDIVFLPVTSDRTPDIEVNGEKWEIKSPLGRGKHVIEDQIKRASKQSLNIIIDARRCKLHIARVRNHLKYNVSLRPHLKQVLLINKKGEVEVIK
jgi:hypothetical protein